jgi:predicted DNA-binding transcriptional regulator YafY
MLSAIKKAIEGRQVLEINYPPGKRIIEPHALGYSADGNVLLRAYQTSGASASGEHANWKLFRIDRAGSVGPNGKTFGGPRPDYRRGDSAMRGGVIAEL